VTLGTDFEKTTRTNRFILKSKVVGMMLCTNPGTQHGGVTPNKIIFDFDAFLYLHFFGPNRQKKWKFHDFSLNLHFFRDEIGFP
jgi:hypothetical protein